MVGASATVEFDVVHARILRFFPELVSALGGDPRILMQAAGIAQEASWQDGAGATYRQQVELVEHAAQELRCPDFGMRLALRQSGGSMFGPLGMVMKNSSSLGEALDYVTSHAYAHSRAVRIWLKRSACGKGAFVGHDILLDRLPNRSQAVEQLLLLGQLCAVEITDGQARVRKVRFRHQPVSPLRTYRRNFGCEVCFGQNEDGVEFSERDLACRIVRPDAQAYRAATSFIDSEFAQRRVPLRAQARGVIMQLLPSGQCTNDRVAAELALHPRTLHRRLREEGTSFQQIKDEVRRDALLYFLLQTDIELTSISERLGFAEQSVMSRRCNRWFAASPSRLRSQGGRRASAS